MVRVLVILLLASATAFGQAAPGAPNTSSTKAQGASPAAKRRQSSTPGKASAAAGAVGPAVITVQGLCASATGGIARPAADSTKTSCISTISKSSFEELVRAVAPNVPPAMRRNVAQQLVELLALAQAA
jgi:hypothetical protein